MFQHNIERYELSKINGLKKLFGVLLLFAKNLKLSLDHILEACAQSLDNALLEIGAHLELGLQSLGDVGEDFIVTLLRICELIFAVNLIINLYKLLKCIHDFCNLLI